MLIAAGAPAVVHKSLDRVRQYVAGSLGEVDPSKHSLSWVTGKTAPSDCLLVNDYYRWPKHRTQEWKQSSHSATGVCLLAWSVSPLLAKMVVFLMAKVSLSAAMQTFPYLSGMRMSSAWWLCITPSQQQTQKTCRPAMGPASEQPGPWPMTSSTTASKLQASSLLPLTSAAAKHVTALCSPCACSRSPQSRACHMALEQRYRSCAAQKFLSTSARARVLIACRREPAYIQAQRAGASVQCDRLLA